MSTVQFLRWKTGRTGSQLGLILLLVALLALTACGGEASAEPAPPTIYYGEDICEFCGMIISEERYAAGYITADGEEHIFDDLGDMVQSHLQKQDDVTAFFVHDHDSLKWIRAETAHYALAEELPTPMLSGLAAFDSTEEAESFAAQLGGEVLTFEELLVHYRENPPTPFFAGSVED